MSEEVEDLAVQITKLFIPLDVPDTLGSINFAEKASEVAGLLIDALGPALSEVLEALEALKEDYADSEGCYCGQIVGGTKEGEPLGVCGFCKAVKVLGSKPTSSPSHKVP